MKRYLQTNCIDMSSRTILLVLSFTTCFTSWTPLYLLFVPNNSTPSQGIFQILFTFPYFSSFFLYFNHIFQICLYTFNPTSLSFALPSPPFLIYKSTLLSFSKTSSLLFSPHFLQVLVSPLLDIIFCIYILLV